MVLGPLEVRNAGQPVPVRGARERAVLAALLLAKGRLVPIETLIDATWAGQPPYAAGKAVRNVVSALRGRLSRADGTGLIETGAAGYRLPLAGVYLDVVDFEQRVAEARTLAAAGNPGPAAEKLRAGAVARPGAGRDRRAGAGGGRRAAG